MDEHGFSGKMTLRHTITKIAPIDNMDRVDLDPIALGITPIARRIAQHAEYPALAEFNIQCPDQFAVNRA
jgi:hypothetical protein